MTPGESAVSCLLVIFTVRPHKKLKIFIAWIMVSYMISNYNLLCHCKALIFSAWWSNQLDANSFFTLLKSPEEYNVLICYDLILHTEVRSVTVMVMRWEGRTGSFQSVRQTVPHRTGAAQVVDLARGFVGNRQGFWFLIIFAFTSILNITKYLYSLLVSVMDI